MKSNQVRAERGSQMQVAPDETQDEAARFFDAVRLRLLMKQREEAVKKLIGLDYDIWVLEELFRTRP